jgi:prophage regulatory protein
MTKSLDYLPAEFNRQRVLSAAEAALFLNLSLPHFRRLYRNGGVPAPIKLSTRRVGWQMSVLIGWVEARQSRTVTA